MIAKMRCLLAIDAGGTKCDALLVSDTGEILGRGRRDLNHLRGQLYFGGLGRSHAAINAAIGETTANYSNISSLHVAGILPEPFSFRDLSDDAIMRHHISEKEGPLILAGVDSGVVVLAGTGAFVYGRTKNGEEALFDGIGPLYGDYGSGFQIGLAGIRASGRAGWHPSNQTSLSEFIPLACKELAGNPREFNMMLFMAEPRDRSEIAALAEIVNREAEKGDAIALSIIQRAAEEIALTVDYVVQRLEMSDEAYPLIATGGVATGSKIYWDHLCESVFQFAPQFVPTLPKYPAVMGMVLEMAQRMRILNPQFRTTLLDSFALQTNLLNAS